MTITWLKKTHTGDIIPDDGLNFRVRIWANSGTEAIGGAGFVYKSHKNNLNFGSFKATADLLSVKVFGGQHPDRGVFKVGKGVYLIGVPCIAATGDASVAINCAVDEKVGGRWVTLPAIQNRKVINLNGSAAAPQHTQIHLMDAPAVKVGAKFKIGEIGVVVK